MSGDTSAERFLATVPGFASFGQIVDPRRYAPLPDDWLVGLADVVGSTRAIEAGQYKAVNMAGAAVISAVSNALGNTRYPFVFGGDGASFALPPDAAPSARAALAATATFVTEAYGLKMRIAEVPMTAVREAGFDVRVARFAASPDLDYAMFTGGGLLWAETQMKAGDYAIPAAPAGTRPDLTGLSCRFEAIPARRGVILSLIVRPVTPDGAGAEGSAYRALVEEIIRRVEDSPEMARPVPEGGPPMRWPPRGLDLEARTTALPGGLGRQRLRLLGLTGLAYLVMRFRVRLAGFDPRRYLRQVVANSDYRKYDDGLRMTIDCDAVVADAIEARLVTAAAAGIATYGVHRQSAALMTCLTPSVQRSDHIHFLDGAAGGYSAAALAMKGRAG